MSQYTAAASGHGEDVPEAVLRALGGALHEGHGPYLPGQYSALLICSRDKLLVGQFPQCDQVGPHAHFAAN